MRTHALVVAGLLCAAMAAPAGWAAAQGPEPFRARMLRHQIEERFSQRVKVELGLTEEQNQRVQQITQTHARRRILLEDDQMRYRRAIGDQMRPGVAANQDSVAKLTDAMMAARVEYVRTFQDEMKDLAQVLTPLQRAQFFILRDRLMQRVEEVRQDRPPPNRRP